MEEPPKKTQLDANGTFSKQSDFNERKREREASSDKVCSKQTAEVGESGHTAFFAQNEEM